jgi:integral membrane protein (TIGR01906 family)
MPFLMKKSVSWPIGLSRESMAPLMNKHKSSIIYIPMRGRGNNMKIVDRILLVFWNVCLLLLILAFAVLPIARSERYYVSQFAKNNTTEKTGFTEEELQKIARHIIDYLYGAKDDFPYHLERTGEDVFSEQAVLHMQDVKVLFTVGRIGSLVVLVIFLALTGYFVYRRQYAYLPVFKMSLWTICGVVVAIVGIVIWILVYYLKEGYLSFFEAGFIVFHKIIFPDQSKFEMAVTFAPDDNLILILEEKFFASIASVIAVRFVIALTAILAILYWLQGFLKRLPLKQRTIKNADNFA